GGGAGRARTATGRPGNRGAIRRHPLRLAPRARGGTRARRTDARGLRRGAGPRVRGGGDDALRLGAGGDGRGGGGARRATRGPWAFPRDRAAAHARGGPRSPRGRARAGG